jgi:hypothetical protein
MTDMIPQFTDELTQEPNRETPRRDVKIPPTVKVKPSMRDNKLLKWFVSNIFYPILFLGALIASASMTYDVIGMILPGNTFMQWLSITFYDFGALVWFWMYNTHAEGTRQRASSILIFVIDLIGAGFMIYAELNLGGQALTNPPAWLTRYLINITTLVMFANLAIGYYFKMNSPANLQAAADQDADDDIEEVTRAQQKAYLDANIHTLALPMFARSVARFKMRNGLQMTNEDYAALEGVVNGTVIPSIPSPTNSEKLARALWRTIISFFDGRRQSTPSALPSTTNTDSQPNPSPSNQP